jgi:ribosomal protein L37AE/L43A
MMDEKYLEGAEELVSKLTEWKIQEAQVRQPRPENYDGRCPDCDEVVHPERIALGYFNCVDCQATLEKRRALK